jgi:hypothetical protein
VGGQPFTVALRAYMLNLRRTLIAITLLVSSMPLIAGNFFPPEYKTFPFKEGDLISSKDKEGKFSVSKVLKIDKVTIKKGSSINIQSKSFTATEDDFLLIISTAYGKKEFRSLEEAKVAAKNNAWHVELGHIPNRAPGAADGQTLVGHSPVLESELDGYKIWKAAFDKGDAGVF